MARVLGVIASSILPASILNRRRFDIDKKWVCTAIGNCIRCRDIGMTHGDDFVARRNSEPLESAK